MAKALYDKGREGFLDGSIDWDTDDIRCILVDISDYGKAITDATNATPIVITSTAHGFSNGHKVVINGVVGNTAANGLWVIANVAANTFELVDSTGNAAYTSGGIAINLTADDNLDDIPGAARVAVSGALAGKTVTHGVADANDETLSAVTGDESEALVIYKHTGTESTSRLIAYMDSGIGLPVIPSGGDIVIMWSSGDDKIFKL